MLKAIQGSFRKQHSHMTERDANKTHNPDLERTDQYDFIQDLLLVLSISRLLFIKEHLRIISCYDHIEQMNILYDKVTIHHNTSECLNSSV